MAPDRGALLNDLADRMTRAGDSIPGSWTGFAVVAEITALGVRVTGFRYDGDEPGLPILMDTDAIQAIADLRSASPGPHGELFDIYVARLERANGRILDQAFTAQTGTPYRVTARSVTAVAELVRPGPPYLPVAAPAAPPVPAAEPMPAPAATPTPTPTAETDREPQPAPALARHEPDPEPDADPGQGAGGSLRPIPIPSAQHAPEPEPALQSVEVTSSEPSAPPMPEPEPTMTSAPEPEPAVTPTPEPSAPPLREPEPTAEVTPEPSAPPLSEPEPTVTSPPQPEPTVTSAPEPSGSPLPEPTATPAPAPAPPTAQDTAALTADVVGWDELAGDDWTGYGAAVAFWPRVVHTVGFRYGSDGAVPTYVGGAFHRHLREYRDAHARELGPDREPAGAALLRMTERSGPVQVRLIYPPASSAIRWDAPDAELARRLAPPTAPSTTLVARPDPDRLDPSELVARISADVRASLRSRDDWVSFAMAFDVGGQRSAAFLYHDDGSSEPFRLPMPVVTDLSELRDQTARPDGSRWVGAVLQSWAATDRVDLSFWGQSGINSFLLDAAGNNGLQMRPPSQPPEYPPAFPWPEVGGYLDRDRLLNEVTSRIGHSPALDGPDWDRLAVVISFGEGSGTEVRGLRYLGLDGPVAETALDDVGPIGKLRRSFRTPNGNLPDVLVLSGHRGGPGLDVSPLFGPAADDLTALPTGPLIDRVRPS